MRAVVLGCGASDGTPSLATGWGACDPAEPRNRRRRPSILVEEGDTRILVDTSPDLREQLLDAGVNRLDAVLFTHPHADHLHGIDDLRAINRVVNAPIPAYADTATLAEIRARFGYVLEPMPEGATQYYKPTLVSHEVTPGRDFRVGAIRVRPFDQHHGYSRTLGFRFGPLAYTTDAVALDEDAFGALAGVAVWIVGALYDSKPHPTHANLDTALAWIERVRPGWAVLTHLSGRLDYATLKGRLPRGVEPAYDGMVVEAEEPSSKGEGRTAGFASSTPNPA